MRLLFLFLTFLLGCSPAMAGADIPSSTSDMLHLTVTATNVRLRAEAGTMPVTTATADIENSPRD